MIATQITKIEFDNPVNMYPGDTLNITFTRPAGSDEMVCDVVLRTADGQQIVIGENVEDIVDGE
jgi:hypothetical protein